MPCYLGRELPSHHPSALPLLQEKCVSPLFPSLTQSEHVANTSQSNARTEGLGDHNSCSLGKVREEGLLGLAWPLGF